MRDLDRKEDQPALPPPIRKPAPVVPDRVIDAKEGVFQDAQGRMYTAKPTNEAATVARQPTISELWGLSKRHGLDLS